MGPKVFPRLSLYLKSFSIFSLRPKILYSFSLGLEAFPGLSLGPKILLWAFDVKMRMLSHLEGVQGDYSMGYIYITYITMEPALVGVLLL